MAKKLVDDSPMLKMGGWYEHCIEEPIRDVVKVLRNHGFNTECSCGHEMYIQCKLSVDGEIGRLHDLLYCYFSERKESVDYEIIVRHKVVDGHSYTSMDVQLPKGYDKVYSLEEAKQWFNSHPIGKEVICIYKEGEHKCSDYSRAEVVYEDEDEDFGTL